MTPRKKRPGAVTAAAVIAFINAVPGLLVAGLCALTADIVSKDPRRQLGIASPTVLYAFAVYDVVLTVFLVWGGIAALRGRSNKILIATAVVGIVGQLVVTGLLLKNPAALLALSSTGTVILILLLLKPSRAYFDPSAVVEDVAPQQVYPDIRAEVPKPVSRPWWHSRAKIVGAAAVALTVAIVVVAVSLTTGQSSAPSRPTTARPAFGAQIKLPITGISDQRAMAVDRSGTVYVPDSSRKRVVKLTAGSSIPTEVTITGLEFFAEGIAVGVAGDLYLTDAYQQRVLKLTVGSNIPTVLPFPGVEYAKGVAVDMSGNVYVTDIGRSQPRVLMLAAGSSTPPCCRSPT